MTRKEWPLWFKSGLVSICFGIVLYLIYMAVLPQLRNGIGEPMQILMMITGHFLFIIVGFSYPGLQACGHNSLMCSNIVDLAALLAVCGILLIYYFGIGALIGRIAEKILERKK